MGLPGFEPGSIAPEATSLDQASRKPLLEGLYPHLQVYSKPNQYALTTRINTLSKLVPLNVPMIVERAIYNLNVSNNYKNKLFEAYQVYCNAHGLAYQKPKKLPISRYVIHVPTENKIDRIIACCGWTYSVVFSLSKYGLRPDELGKLTLRDFDSSNNKLTVPTSKLGNQRTLTLKPQIADMLKTYINRRGLANPNSKLFASTRKIKAAWAKYRKCAYQKFNDPELLKIRLYDLRHWYGTNMYLETHDIFYVSYLLGHRQLANTLIYIHLSKAFENYDGNYTCKIAKTLDEASQLIEAGFEYVTEMDNVKLFKKRK